ncbi:GNAT family N-acetyltransferase [Chitinispirillales bacterium ANBcel5]|uniref:GNAT family N-acetyltransferase n=1 Tax=Cellulosispirillum alkaliphilum TaxID=3039283 RepID=UPI002A582A5F|nr:GNAT family N-acetyltransferase [Chitinispirillales bacterium ANBcel5]
MEKLHNLNKSDLIKATNVLADAFKDDPVWNKAFEHEQDYENKFKSFFETPLRYTGKYGTIFSPSKNLEGVATLIPGKYADMTIWRMILSGAMVSALRMGSNASNRLAPLFKQLSQDRKRIMKNRKFNYLLIIGVAIRYQGKGYGKKLLDKITEVSDKEGVAVYLETETEKNVPLYEKFGFKVVNKITVPKMDLPMWQMVREVN